MYKSIVKELEGKLKKTASVYSEDLKSIRAGRANPALLDKIEVESYGVPTPLKQVASISAPEARLLVIQPWDPNMIQEIEKAIQKSDLGITPSNDGKVIRLPLPILTEERRKELVRVVRKEQEQSKIAVRNLRRDAMDTVKKMEKNSELREDELRTAEQEIQKTVDNAIKEIDAITEAKETELLEI
ncbi:MAG: ribosome recycling factor [Tissierellia bacterium]|jgi:ribosome recycling factor|nr:ribosome recycling factor [Bacillota bacterium]NLK59247.1 ribosome recycling factor [Tissierellia bacterium]